MSLQWTMHMALDFASGRIDDKPHLLLEFRTVSGKLAFGWVQFPRIM